MYDGETYQRKPINGVPGAMRKIFGIYNLGIDRVDALETVSIEQTIPNNSELIWIFIARYTIRLDATSFYVQDIFKKFWIRLD